MNECPEIIVVEDDADIRETISEILRLEGYGVQAYCNGKEAIDGLRNCKDPCLILLDLMMPVMNGWEFLEQRKNLGDTIVAIPVFIVSAIADRGQIDRAGATGYIKKPVDIDVLLKLIHNHCDAESKTSPGDRKNAA